MELVGYATLEDIERAKALGAADSGRLDYGGIVDRVKAVDRNISTFRSLQMQSGISAQHFREAKENLRAELRELEAELNADLAFKYGVTKPEDLPGFVESHKPFHWYVEFHDILHHGGFDVMRSWTQPGILRSALFASWYLSPSFPAGRAGNPIIPGLSRQAKGTASFLRVVSRYGWDTPCFSHQSARATKRPSRGGLRAQELPTTLHTRHSPPHPTRPPPPPARPPRRG